MNEKIRWVKASERMPDPSDKTSVDGDGDCICRWRSSFGWRTESLHTEYVNADDDTLEWLEGWNVQEEPVRYVIAKVRVSNTGEVSTHSVTYTGMTAKQALLQHAEFYGPGKYQVDDGRAKQVFTVEAETVYRVTDLRGGE